MNVAIWVERQNGQYSASVFGAPGVRAMAESREKAVAELCSELEHRMSAGELVVIDVAPKGLLGLAGRYTEDEESRKAWEEVVAEIYRERDEEKRREFPE